MTQSLSVEQTRLLRLRSQNLHPETARSISDAGQLVSELCGLQSQELSSVYLAVRARTSGLTVEDVQHSREVERSIILTWAMRGTMHLIAAEDAQWLLALFGPVFIRSGERRYKELGLDEDTRRKAARLIRDTLGSRGPLTRAELAEILAPDGIPVAGQAMPHLLGYAALSGMICFGPERDGEFTYVVQDDWLKSRKQRQIASDQFPAELARRYLQGHAPATPYDLANWSGLSIGLAKAGFTAIAEDLIEVSSAWMLKQQLDWLDELSNERIVRLLPRFDDYLLGYKSRDFMVAPAYAKRIYVGGGLFAPSLIVDGLAGATWRNQRKKKLSTLVLEPFEPLSPDLIPLIQAEAQDIGRFLGQETQLQV